MNIMNPLNHFGIKSRMIRSDTSSYNYDRFDQSMDNYITGHYGEDQFPHYKCHHCSNVYDNQDDLTSHELTHKKVKK